MTSKVNKHLKLSTDGMTVDVVGPILKWESDEQSAVFSVEITQTQAGVNVSAAGSSNAVYRSDTPWKATAHVTGATPLHVGRAKAKAIAKITLASGKTERYVWPVRVELVDHLAHLPEPSDAAQLAGART
jgi:hypothetical protein